MMLNKPATAREKIQIHLTVFIPTDGITCFDGTVSISWQIFSGLFLKKCELKVKILVGR